MFTDLEHFNLIFGPFRLFGYVTVRILAAAVTAFLFGVLSAPWFIKQLSAMKQSQKVRYPDDGRPYHLCQRLDRLASLDARKPLWLADADGLYWAYGDWFFG